MHRSETEELVPCSDCGAEVSIAGARAFTFGSAGVLCWDCAVRRGGSYDAQHERWSTAPRTGDLHDEDS